MMEKVFLTEHQVDIRSGSNGSKIVILTPDDILTLKLLRDHYRRYVSPYRSSEEDRALETLERILKQVG